MRLEPSASFFATERFRRIVAFAIIVAALNNNNNNIEMALLRDLVSLEILAIET